MFFDTDGCVSSELESGSLQTHLNFHFWGNFVLCLMKNPALLQLTVQTLMTLACQMWRCRVDGGGFTDTL